MSHARPEAALQQTHRLQLPPAPESETGDVKAWREPVTMFTFLPEQPDPNPMFLEKRVYQGSSGKVYPLPFIDRIATVGQDRAWEAVHLENEYLRVMILPEIGGRIHVGLDKLNGYDFFYRQNVIKPALVGLAGPWISGGVEFNWPQHHRPATFLPVEVAIERAPDGSITVWCGDHDPMERMKGMHGVCLHPGAAYLELKVRLYNRTRLEQTFLWWANAATRVHEQYQSFFPTDVRHVADHAKRAVSRFPRSEGAYYGVDYAERARSGVPDEERPRLYRPDGSYPADDLSWYSNIPVPTSYMITGTEQDFFGGYDHAARAGMVHVANHHISPGKKQWTWGNHEFGYAWDRNLTEDDGPYIELMAGVYTDNQPDFSFLAPGETKAFSQFWYPIREIGVPHAANLDAALSLRVDRHRARLAVGVTRDFPSGRILIQKGGEILAEWSGALRVARAIQLDCRLPEGTEPHHVNVTVTANKREILRYSPAIAGSDSTPPPVATELPLPEAVATNEELYLAGLHLRQYRHATRRPEMYWREGLRRDPADSNCNHALGQWHLRRGEFALAETHLRRSLERLTKLNPNPQNGECLYSLGQALLAQGRRDEAYAAFYKATWNFGVRAAAYHALAELDAARGEMEAALGHLKESLRLNLDNLNARNLAVVALRRLGRADEAAQTLAETRKLDPLDIWSRFLDTGEEPADNQLRLDLAWNCARAGLWDDAISLLTNVDASVTDGSGPIMLYTLAWLHAKRGDHPEALATWKLAAEASPRYSFPSRLEEIAILDTAIAKNPDDARAPYYLGNLLYDRRRHEEAIALWERSARLDPAFPTVWRNLGFAYFNVQGEASKAREAFDRAVEADPRDARILYERDQLWKRMGEAPERRLEELERHPHLVKTRDDLAAELVTLYNGAGRLKEALDLLQSRHFQPWEGGEGLVLDQWSRTNLLLGRRSLDDGEPRRALSFFEAATTAPANLGEARHLLANQSEAYYWIGVAYSRMNNQDEAERWWQRAARRPGDFQDMSVQTVSDKTYWNALALRALGRRSEATDLLRAIGQYSRDLEQREPKIDYFATSLPAMLLFEDDLAQRNRVAAMFLRAQSCLGLGLAEEATALLKAVLSRDGNHSATADLLQTGLFQRVTKADGLVGSLDRSDTCTLPTLPR